MEQEAERPQLAYCAAVALPLVLDKTRGNMRMFRCGDGWGGGAVPEPANPGAPKKGN